MGYTVRVSNVSSKATERDIYDFFAFSGEISSIQTGPDPGAEGTQEAFVTFHEERSLETALLLTGAVIADKPVNVELAEGYKPPPTSQAGSYAAEGGNAAKAPGSEDTLKKAEGIMATLLANGYILGKDAVEKARTLDQKHDISNQAKLHAESLSKSAAELDSKYAISKKLAETSATVTRSLSTVDEKYHITAKSKEALAVAEASLKEASQYAMQNKYVSSGTSWLMGALGQLKTIATEVQQQAAAKVSKAEEEKVTGQRAQMSSLVEDDDEDAGRRSGSVKNPEALGLADHGPPVAGTSGGAPPAAPTSLLDAPVPASTTQAPSVKAAASLSDPPVF